MRTLGISVSILALASIPSATAVSRASVGQPSGGQTLVLDDVRVTLLDARLLSEAEDRASDCDAPATWPGGGLHMSFLVENRPGETTPPVLGEIRVLVDSRLYNPVTNATSRKPLAPCVIFRDAEDFWRTDYGRQVRYRPQARPASVSGIVEAFVRGGRIRPDAEIVIELEQGATHEGGQPPRSLRASDIAYRWFRFTVPSR